MSSAPLGAVPRQVVWDQEGCIGQIRGGRQVLTGEFHAFRGTFGMGATLVGTADPEAKGLVERANGHLETGKTHLAIGLGIRACHAGHRVAFATASQWVSRLAEAHTAGKLQAELTRLGRIRFSSSTKSDTSPSKPKPPYLLFQLVSARYERASVIVASNKPFGRWGEIFGDPVVAAAMIDRLVHHAEVVSLRGDSYRFKARDLGRVPTDNTEWRKPNQRGQFSPGAGGLKFRRC
jgi:hypothetical protein